ncbi:MAG: hypothetical protein AAFU79_10655 [Myxococcota bacterium]
MRERGLVTPWSDSKREWILSILDEETRFTISQLSKMGLGKRAISRALKLSRNIVRSVLDSGEAAVPRLQRKARLEDHIEKVRTLHETCDGNLVRVREELTSRHALEIAYSTLTHFCRREGMGAKPRILAGRYHFNPGEEVHHDTSRHEVLLGDKRRKL